MAIAPLSFSQENIGLVQVSGLIDPLPTPATHSILSRRHWDQVDCQEGRAGHDMRSQEPAAGALRAAASLL